MKQRVDSLKVTYIFIILSIGCMIIYLQTCNYGFFNIDDDKCVYTNSIVRQGINLKGIWGALTSFNNYRYVPITTISQEIDCWFWGLWAGGHHISNLVIYILSVCALYVALLELTKNKDLSILVSFLYAFHPMHVETVVWITQRNDLLAGLFLFISLFSYCKSFRKNSMFWYVSSIITYILAVGSKGTVIGYPVMLLACDYWPLGRFQKSKMLSVLAEKIPFLIISCFSAVLNLIANHVPVEPFPPLSLMDRLANNFMAHSKYFCNIFAPLWVGSYTFYGDRFNYSLIYFIALIFSAITLGVIILRKRHPILLMGWIWYNAMLFPMTGLVTTIGQYFGDRYVYISKIGLLMIFSSFVLDAVAKYKNRYFSIWSFIIVLIIFEGFLSFRQTQYWETNQKLWMRYIQVDDSNAIAHLNLACLLAGEGGDTDKSYLHCLKAIQLNPNFGDAHLIMGKLLLSHNDVSGALKELYKAIEVRPQCLSARILIAQFLFSNGSGQQGIDQLREIYKYYSTDPNIVKWLYDSLDRMNLSRDVLK